MQWSPEFKLNGVRCVALVDTGGQWSHIDEKSTVNNIIRLDDGNAGNTNQYIGTNYYEFMESIRNGSK